MLKKPTFYNIKKANIMKYNKKANSLQHKKANIIKYNRKSQRYKL